MRLLRTDTFEFNEFWDGLLPPYAILSHRWTDSELSYREFVNDRGASGTGLEKIQRACEVARNRGHYWLWIDTICIDKSSSAELSEAINSMWHWYGSAVVCYAHLADIYNREDKEKSYLAMSESEWFTRGWTLQELIAPHEVLFLDADWQLIGSKTDYADLVCQITSIDKEFLLGTSSIKEASVAMKMSWAAMRTTTRTEDQAYCLLGLFDVNMPLLYGERERAFFRLQLEILRSSDDESIFAWRASSPGPSGMLARSPYVFKSSGNIRKMELRPEQRVPWSWTNKGLEFRILSPASKDNMNPMPTGKDEELVHLGCYIDDVEEREEGSKPESRRPSATRYNLSIGLKRYGNAWYRTHRDSFMETSGFAVVDKTPRAWRSGLVYRYYYVPQEMNNEVTKSHPWWNKN